jgi:hypothetical protein
MPADKESGRCMPLDDQADSGKQGTVGQGTPTGF